MAIRTLWDTNSDDNVDTKYLHFEIQRLLPTDFRWMASKERSRPWSTCSYGDKDVAESSADVIVIVWSDLGRQGLTATAVSSDDDDGWWRPSTMMTKATVNTNDETAMACWLGWSSKSFSWMQGCTDAVVVAFVFFSCFLCARLKAVQCRRCCCQCRRRCC